MVPIISMKFSLVTIAKNEGLYIDTFLNHYRTWVDEIVVVDNGSSDDTVSIAQRYTKNVTVNPEPRFDKLRQFAIKQAKYDWILLLDVDELANEELKSDIKSVMINPHYFAYLIKRQNFFGSHKLVGKYGTENFIRLFNRRQIQIKPAIVHDKVETKKPQGKLGGALNHYTYKSVGQTLRKFTEYNRREAFLGSEKVTVTFKHFTAFPAHMFWSLFIDDRGYRDGIYGFVLAMLFAYSEFTKYLFLLLENIHKKSVY